MALSPQVFRFHDIAIATIRSNSSFARGFFNAEYGYHRLDGAAAEPFTGQTAPDGLPRVNLKFQLGPGTPPGFTHTTHKVLARWNYLVTIQPREIDLRVRGNRAAVSMVHHMLLHPSLRWLTCHAGTLLLHAGAVVKNNKSLIFTGKGGAGKTTTTSLVLASGQGWQVHADDYVFLREGQSLAYVTRSHLYRDLQKWVPAVRERLTFWEKARLEFFGALRKYSHEGLKWPVRLSPQRLWPGTPITATACTRAILLLERADVSRPQLIPVTNLELAASDLLEMNFGEARHFLSLLQKAGVFDDKWLSDWKTTELHLLNNLTLKTPTYRLVLPLMESTRSAQASLLPVLDELVQ
jgi:hypothetical protein